MNGPIDRALFALQHALDPRAPELASHWRAVARFIGYQRPNIPDRVLPDGRQEALIAVFESIGTMTAPTADGRRGWLRSVLRNRARDIYRVEVRPIYRVTGSTIEAEREHPGDAAAEPRSDVLATVRDTLVKHVEAGILDIPIVYGVGRSTNTQIASRRVWRAQATVAIDALIFERDGADLAAEHRVSRDVIYKWIERGRPFVLAGLDRWECSVVHDLEGAIVERARERVSERRADVGLARPERRSAA